MAWSTVHQMGPLMKCSTTSSTTYRGYRSSRAENASQGEGAKAQQETRSPSAGQWSCLTQQSQPVTGCVKVEIRSACAPPLLRGRGRMYPHTAPLAPWDARSSVCSRVARRLRGRHSSVAASPLRCRTVFLWGAVPREGRHLVSSGGLVARRHMPDTSLSSMWGDWILIAWRVHVSQGTKLRIRFQSWSSIRLVRGDSRWVHPPRTVRS